MCFGYSKEPSHRDGSFEYPQHKFWLINKNLVYTVKLVLNGHSKRRKLVFKTDYRLMQVKSISAIFSTFIKLPFVFKTFVLSIFEWPLKTGFTVFRLSNLIVT